MAITLEQVERLRERADISYEEARALLQETDGDVLEALIRLERQGRIGDGSSKGSFYSTQPPEDVQATMLAPVTFGKGSQRAEKEKEQPGFWGQLKQLLLAALKLLRRGVVNQLEVWRNGELMTSIPLLILIILVIVAFWISVPLLLVGLLCGCRYRFSGPDLNPEKVNQVMDSVAATVNGVVEQVKDEFQKAGKKEK